jgi:protein-tyrosine phosphatase
VKVVLDFREPWGRADENKACEALGIAHVSIPIGDMVLYAAVGMTPPTEAELDKSYSWLVNAMSAPVFAHCQHGRDRTGGVMAWYRMKHQGWTNAAALAEALTFGIQEEPIINWIREYKC